MRPDEHVLPKPDAQKKTCCADNWTGVLSGISSRKGWATRSDIGGELRRNLGEAARSDLGERIRLRRE
jgi:hypothetical protein